MRKVVGIGETVLDIIFKNDQPIGAVPGGSVFNGVISLGRSGVDATFISEAGNDRVGRKIVSFLKANGVNADNVSVYPDSKSPISLAFLGDDNSAEYIFYKDHPHDQLDFAYPDVGPDDVVMFGSFYAVNPVIRPQVVAFIEYARSRGAILYYDVNFRASHRTDLIKVTPNILENLEYADIVRGSSEDFETLFKQTDAEKTYRDNIKFYCPNFIYTRGGEGVELFCKTGHRHFDIEAVKPVSTIGAGDTFNAGILYGLIKHDITREKLYDLTTDEWAVIIDYALKFSAQVCLSEENYLPAEYAAGYKL